MQDKCIVEPHIVQYILYANMVVVLECLVAINSSVLKLCTVHLLH